MSCSAVQLDSCGTQDSGHPEHQDGALRRHEQRGLPLHIGTVRTWGLETRHVVSLNPPWLENLVILLLLFEMSPVWGTRLLLTDVMFTYFTGSLCLWRLLKSDCVAESLSWISGWTLMASYSLITNFSCWDLLDFKLHHYISSKLQYNIYFYLRNQLLCTFRNTFWAVAPPTGGQEEPWAPLGKYRPTHRIIFKL